MERCLRAPERSLAENAFHVDIKQIIRYKPYKPVFMRICLFFLITAFLMGCSSTGNQRQEPENQTLETILNRKSVRKYKDRPVEKEKIDN